MSLLVIVDMQPAYKPAHYQPVQEAVAKEIVRAMSLGNPIIFLEYREPDSTFVALKQLTAGYDKVETRTKYKWSGADVVVEVCKERGWDMSDTDWTGVETEHCIAQSLGEFIQLVPYAVANVIKEAVNGYIFGWETIPKHERIRLVSQCERVYA